MSDGRGALADLTPEQRARLTERLRERRRAAAGEDRIRPRPDPQQHPVSPAQERIWMLSRLRPDEPVYNVHEATRLRGRLDVTALRHSFAEVVRRHETLRAAFTDEGGHPRQLIASPDHFSFAVVDISDDGDAMAQALRIARQEAERPFNLARGPLLRVGVLRLADDDHVLLVTAHHIVCDGWSMGVIRAEVSAVYRAVTTHRPVQLRALDLQYADVAHWQRQRDVTVRTGLDYWAQRLDDSVERLRLPGDADRPAGRTARGAHHSLHVVPALTSALEQLSRQARVTSFITLMSAFLVLLNRHTGQEDLVVCSPVAGRGRAETERMVGFFNNLVVIRGDLSGDPSFEELLNRMRPVIGGAFDHQDVPFQSVAALSHLATTPLTRALFVLQDAEHRALSLPGVDVTTLTVEAATSDFDLGIFMRPQVGRLVGAARYRTDQFDNATISALLDDFDRVLKLVVADPAQRLSQLPSFTLPSRQVISPDPVTPHVMERPRTAVELQLRDMWERLFGIAPISIHDDFFELGGHSLLAAELAVDVEQRITGSPLPLATLYTAPTIAQLAEVIDRGDWSGSWSSLVAINPSGTRPPLYFVHAHGGNVIGYRDLARRLGPDQPLYGLQSPEIQRVGERPVERRVPEMAKHYLSEIRDVQPHGPYFVGGWCLGGDVAYEMAAQLTADGHDVALVIMVDNPRPSHSRTAISGPATRRLLNRVRTRLDMEWSNLLLTGSTGRASHVRRRATQVAATLLVHAEAVASSTLAAAGIRLPPSRPLRQLRIAQVHEKAYAAYDPPAYSGRVALFRAVRQPRGRDHDPSLGWAPHITGPLDIYNIPGHRVGILSEPRVQAVATQMIAAMDAALAE